MAARYNELLAETTIVPRLIEGATSVWAQYTLRLPGIDREAFQASLKREGVPTAVFYPRSLSINRPPTGTIRSPATASPSQRSSPPR